MREIEELLQAEQLVPEHLYSAAVKPSEDFVTEVIRMFVSMEVYYVVAPIQVRSWVLIETTATHYSYYYEPFHHCAHSVLIIRRIRSLLGCKFTGMSIMSGPLTQICLYMVQQK